MPDIFDQLGSEAAGTPKPDIFDQISSPPTPAPVRTSVQPVQNPVHPLLAGLPNPQQAAQDADLNAQQFTDRLEQLGTQMRSGALSKIPHELRGFTPDELAGPGTFQNPRTGQRSTVAGDQARIPMFDGPMTGVPTIAEGVEQMASPGLPNKAGGAAKVLEGGMDVAAPLAIPAAIVNPVPTVAALAGGTAASEGTKAGLKKLGVRDEYADVAGDVAGLAAGTLAAHGASKLMPKPPINPDAVLPAERTGLDHQVEPAPGGSEASHATIDVKPDVFDEVKPEPTAAAKGGDVFDQAAKEEQSSPPSPQKGATDDHISTVPATEATSGSEEVQRPNAETGRPASDAARADDQQGPASDSADAEKQVAARPPKTAPAYGNYADVSIPGEETTYPARYAVRELEDVQPSHNPQTFERNPDYEHENDRDYSDPQNAARVVEYSQKGNFKPGLTLNTNETAEQGPTIIDQRGNALGGNNRAMTLARVYQNSPEDARAYRNRLMRSASQFGLHPNQIGQFQNPVLVRELTNPIDGSTAQKAITDFNKTATAKLKPQEQAVADGRRLSSNTVQLISANLGDVGDDSTLAQALQGDRGREIIQSLVKDGVITEQEKNGYLDERDQLTGDAKGRIAKALVGRLFENAQDFGNTAPELRNKLERVAPQVLRVEDRPEWSVTQPIREGLTALADAKAHGIKNLDDLARQTDLNGQTRGYSADALAMARTLNQGPVKAAKAFRQYATDAELSRDGAQNSFFEAPTQREAFASAFDGAGAREPVTMQASIEKKAPGLGGEPEPFVTGAGTLFHSLKSRIQPIALSPENAARAHAYVGNASALELLNRAAAGPKDSTVHTGGVHLSPRGAATLARNIEQILLPKTGGAKTIAKQGLQGLLLAAKRAANEGKSLILVKDAAGFTETDRLKGLNEELDHAAQRVASGAGGIEKHLNGSADPLVHTELGKIAYRQLTDNGYTFRSPHQVATEIGVRLMVPGRHGELGLNPSQARSLAAQYVRSLRKEYGNAAPKEIAGRVFDALRPANRPGQQQPADVARGAGPGGRASSPGLARSDLPEPERVQTSPDRGTRGQLHARETTGRPLQQPLFEPDSGKVEQPWPSDTAKPATRPKGGQQQGTLFSKKPPASDGLLGPSMFDAPSTGERSLFDQGEAAEVTDAAARDRDQLQRERLTTQMSAPLSREEQLKGLKRSKTKPQTSMFEDEPEPPQGMLFSKKPLSKDEEEGKYNYSGLGATTDRFVRNLSQLERASEPAHSAAVRAASSRSQASVILKTSTPQIERALGKDTSFLDFRRALIQSRLDGIRDRWQGMADFATRASNENLSRSMARILPLLDNMQRHDLQDNMFQDAAKRAIGRTATKLAENLSRGDTPSNPQRPLDLSDTAASLAEKKDYDLVRKLLSDVFGRAAQNVTRVMTQEEFDGVRNAPGFKKALSTYKGLVEKPMAENHALNEGVFSDALGPLGTYYPLVPVADADVARAQASSRNAYAKPKNIANNFATGLAQDYDASMDALRDRLGEAVRKNNKAALIQSLQDEGLVYPLGPAEDAGSTITYGGQDYQAVKLDVSPARQMVSAGKSSYVPPKAVLVPKWLERELRPILEKPDASIPPGLARQIIERTNEVAVSGPADFVFHSANLFGTLVANTPFLGNSLLGKATSIPVLKRFTAVVRVLAADPMSEGAAADLQHMAELGILPERYASETYSRKFAEQTGAELKRFSAGPMLYGPKGVDIRARLVMYRLAKQINPNATGPELHRFVNQLGIYTKSLQSEFVRGATGSGLAPFAIAGSTMLQNGVNAWTGTSPLPMKYDRKSSAWSVNNRRFLQMKAWGQLNGGIGALALWYLAYKAYSGLWPHDDERAKLFQIPANDKDRDSKLGQMLWGDNSKTGYINFSFFNPLVGRGARALGLKGAYDTAHGGGEWWQTLEAAVKDMVNTYAHPALGPIPRAAFVGLTDNEPYLTGLRDSRARPSPQFMPAKGNRALAAAKELNSFYGNVSEGVGLGEPRQNDETMNRWVRMAFDLALPGLVGNAQNVEGQRSRIRSQANAERRLQSKQSP